MKLRKASKTVTLNIAVSDELHARIKRRAELHCMSMAAFVRGILGIPQLRRYSKALKFL